MTADLTTEQCEALYDLTLEELQSIKTEFVEDHIEPDEAEVVLLLTILATLGGPLTWEQIEILPSEEPPEPPQLTLDVT